MESTLTLTSGERETLRRALLRRSAQTILTARLFADSDNETVRNLFRRDAVQALQLARRVGVSGRHIREFVRLTAQHR